MTTNASPIRTTNSCSSTATRRSLSTTTRAPSAGSSESPAVRTHVRRAARAQDGSTLSATAIDGPLHGIRHRRGLPVIGYVKTHHRRMLAREHWVRVPELTAGERSGLFAMKDALYGCYLRVGDPGPWAGPWAGIARLEMPSGIGRDAAVEAAERAAGWLPLFASALHRDARAPVNLTPIAGLERHRVRLFFVGGPRGFCQRHGKSYLTRRRCGGEGGGGGLLTGRAIPSAYRWAWCRWYSRVVEVPVRIEVAAGFVAPGASEPPRLQPSSPPGGSGPAHG